MADMFATIESGIDPASAEAVYESLLSARDGPRTGIHHSIRDYRMLRRGTENGSRSQLLSGNIFVRVTGTNHREPTRTREKRLYIIINVVVSECHDKDLHHKRIRERLLEESYSLIDADIHNRWYDDEQVTKYLPKRYQKYGIVAPTLLYRNPGGFFRQEDVADNGTKPAADLEQLASEHFDANNIDYGMFTGNSWFNLAALPEPRLRGRARPRVPMSSSSGTVCRVDD